MKRITPIILSFTLFYSVNVAAQTSILKQKIKQQLSGKKATVGISIQHLETGQTLTINNDKHYPMQSVYKFHIAMAVLNQVDKGKLQLQQNIYIKKSDLLPGTWSPIREKYPEGEMNLPLSDLIRYTVAQSDNNGCDILLRLLGGPKLVNNYIHKLGIEDVSIQATEEQMHQSYPVQFSNWSTPKAATDLLLLFYQQNTLSKQSFNFLWETMLSTTTGKKQLRGQLPLNTPVAHKTGNSGTNDKGITAALNDIGIITLPDGTHILISVFVSNSKENSETNESIISDIAKTAWDYFLK
ncbi:beta-lactamase [Pedobacter sp. BAL39]|uniref:class A beta-lactamase, subclass A2 n=1 Tax=Pedobacter sp. BAL39 TaxID=391596 RepID=UPI00015598D6|nr:class A beta-lactamase, subclass A2 [Pedobacter sp. BAL39]EDM37279.1 beta-lactamase [Pedobacter sp. BAL39]